MERFANLEECEHKIPAGEICHECLEQAEYEDMYPDECECENLGSQCDTCDDEA